MAILQIALGWSGEHLYRFVIQGRQYGYDGSLDPHRVRLAALGLRVRERFLYEYDFSDNWQHDVRVEQVLPLAPARTYPRCIAGRRAAPPEDCGGPRAFLERRQRYSAGHIARRLLWHGNVFRALQVVEALELDLDDSEHPSPEQRKLLTTVTEFGGYVRANATSIPNYGERYRPAKPSRAPLSSRP